MRLSVFKRKRTVAGKRTTSRSYYGRYRIDGQPKEKTLCLNTSDKQAAEARLRRIVMEEERAREGLGIAPDLRESLRRPLKDHLMDFVVDRERIGRAPDYVRQLKGKLDRLISECGWQKMSDITPDRFLRWRQKQTGISAKTLNEYLIAAKSFCNWLKKQKRGLSDNPLEGIDGMSTVGQERFKRRALSREEITSLLATSGPRRPLYTVAIYTGLRRCELKQLVWSDVRIEGERPAIHARASTTKNRKTARLNLHARAVSELAALRQQADCASQDALVFADMMPTPDEFRADLALAGIKHTHERRVDFHSLRHTFATLLSVHGVSPRVAMEAMRHSDMRLTMKTYTDPDLLPTAEAIDKLPDFGTDDPAPENIDTAEDGAPKGTRNLGAAMHVLSPSVTHSETSLPAETSDPEEIGRDSTLTDLQKLATEETCAMQGSNLRHLACEASALPLS
jgi:integrase